MADITFMRGYGFPKGAGMDYAGYNGMLVNNRRRQLSAAQRIPFVPEPSIFEKIPALDGMDEAPHFGTEYDLPPVDVDVTGYGPDVPPGCTVVDGVTHCEGGSGGKVLGVLAVGVGLWWLLGR